MFKPQRPSRSRSTRARQDENDVVYNAKTNVKADAQKPVGLKAAAKRTAFQDVSNKRAMRQGEATIEDKPVKAVLSKPAQRTTGLKAAAASVTAAAKVTAGAKRPIKRSAVYQDKKISPRKKSPKPSPKFGRAKKDANNVPALKQNAKRHVVPSRPLSGVARVKVDDTPAYSDVQSPSYLPDARLLQEDYVVDSDATEPEEEEDSRVDRKARFNPEVELISESETEEDESTSYGHGDNTTGVTAHSVLPEWTSEARAELAMLADSFDSYDPEDEFDISMVAEYSDEIYAHMRDLEVSFSLFIFLERRNTNP
jgi:hypothetical protein